MSEDKKVTHEERVSMNVSLSSGDKKFLKVYAAEHETTVAAVIAECINRLKKETINNGR